ncbi:hypothetical protein [Curtobacterium herbarum]|uniref:Uncharacterized protein n=1 Tax=Curtobacterium herbarum TaxID=150122 RepID=A0ABN1ZAW5_9MICO|nr:hypothetical protein [Curtobacterium herbarum]MBM7475489.1 putative membrane protein [Curtobacterium herbarum]MCS6543405.1 hypothetical protein [Curtobacterium herbarum]
MPEAADGAPSPSFSWPEEEPDQRTIAVMNTRRKAFRVTARTGFIVAPVMFLLPLLIPLLSGDYSFLAIVCMTAAWAVLVSATSFQAMAHTKAGGQPWLHQLWAVPAAVIAMLPGGLAAFELSAAVVQAVYHATK